MSTPIHDLRYRCKKVIDTNGTEDEIKALMVEAKAYYPQIFQEDLEYIFDVPSIKNLTILYGWLGKYVEQLSRSQSNVHIEAAANSNAVVNIDISQTIEMIENSGLSETDIEKIKASLMDLMAAKNQNPSAFADKLSKVLDIAKKSTDAVRPVLEFIQPLIQQLMS